MPSYVAAIDQGTTSSRCILFDHDGKMVASHQLEHAQITRRPGWVEHDADEIVERVRTCVKVAMRDGTTYPATVVGEDELNDLAAAGIPKAAPSWLMLALVGGGALLVGVIIVLVLVLS